MPAKGRVEDHSIRHFLEARAGNSQAETLSSESAIVARSQRPLRVARSPAVFLRFRHGVMTRMGLPTE